MHLHELMGWPGPMTHRQFGAWQNWLARQLNEPSRSDHYLMQIAAWLKRGLVKEPRSVSDSEFRIRFEVSRPPTPEEAAFGNKLAYLAWFASMGVNVERSRAAEDGSPAGG